MEKSNETVTGTAEREIILTRLVNAPRELVFKAWTQPEHLAQWFGPDGFTLTVNRMEVRNGGTWLMTMHGPDDTDYPNRMIFSEIVPPERLVYTQDSGMDDDPAQFHVTVTLDNEGGKTRLTMRALFSTAEEREKVVREHGAIEGGNQTINRLEEHLAKMQQGTV